jgi:DNA polymerase (family X)
LRRGDKSIAAKTEAGIYKALGLQYIEPELREGRGEIALGASISFPG